MRWLSALFAVLIIAGAAQAQIGLPAGQAQLYPHIAGGTPFGVCDLSGITCTHGWSAGCVKSGTQKAFQYKDNNGTTADFTCSANSNVPLNGGQGPAAWCAAAPCHYSIIYDQIGSCDLSNASAGVSASVTLNSQAIFAFDGNANHFASSCTPSDTPASAVIVDEQTSPDASQAGAFYSVDTPYNLIFAFNNTASSPFFTCNATGSITGSATDNTWNVHVGVCNGSSSTYTINGTTNSGTLTAGGGAATTFSLGGSTGGTNPLNGNIAEMVTMSNVLDSTHVTSVTNNERGSSRWNF